MLPPLRPAVAVALPAALASLALPSTLGYDPWAWAVWGRELAHLDLSTTGGPSFKPLPVVVAAVASPAGGLMPEVWVVVVRAAGLLGVVLAYRVAARFGGALGGAIAAVAVALAASQARNGLQGYSEPLLICLTLASVDMHLEGRRRWAFAFGALGSLVRPELWVLLALYAAYLWSRDTAFRPVATGSLAAIPAVWIGLDWWGSGELLHGGSVARSTPPESAALTDRPAFTVLRRSAELVMLPALVGAVAAVVLALRRGVTVVALLGGAVALWVGAVAVMAELGFTGNIRYLAVPAGLLAVLGGIGAGWLVQSVQQGRARLLAAAAASILVLGFAFAPARSSGRWLSIAREQHEQLEELESATDRAGGPGGVREAGRPAINPSIQSALAWQLDVPLSKVQATWGPTPAHPHWSPPAIVFRAPPRFAGPPPAVDGRQVRPIARAGRWEVFLARGRLTRLRPQPARG
ncbi:MAG TPA: hypothetical protein VFQ12_10235 [Thermoleophilaceae bacterium]|nr:hypothetical protein [Thermoleophilaceae bacterium]